MRGAAPSDGIGIMKFDAFLPVLKVVRVRFLKSKHCKQ